MRKSNYKNKGEHYIAYRLEYPLSDAELKCLRITRKDVTWMGKNRPYYMVPCDNPDICKKCKAIFEEERDRERQYWRCLKKNDNGLIVKCQGKCSECTEPIKSMYVSLSNLLGEESEVLADESESSRVDNDLAMEIILDEMERLGFDSYVAYIRDTMANMKTREIAEAEGKKSHSTVVEGRKLAVELAIKIYNGEK